MGHWILKIKLVCLKDFRYIYIKSPAPNILTDEDTENFVDNLSGNQSRVHVDVELTSKEQISTSEKNL